MPTSWMKFVGGGKGPKGDPGVPGAGYAATSTTPLPVQMGSATIAPGVSTTALAYVVGSRIRIASAANAVHFLEGRITAISGGSYTVVVDHVGGSGTHADWNLSLAGDVGGTGSSGATEAQGEPGPQGDQGPQGDPGEGLPALGGGDEGKVLLVQGGAAAWALPQSLPAATDAVAGIMAAADKEKLDGLPPAKSGAVALPADSSSVELWRFAPGANKKGKLLVDMRGGTNGPSAINVFDQLGYRTDGDGKVFLQSNAPAVRGGGTPQGYSGALSPPAPSDVNVSNDGNYTLTVAWTTPLGADVNGVLIEYSFDGTGNTWDLSRYVAGNLGSFDLYRATGWGAGGGPVKARVLFFNDFGLGTFAMGDGTWPSSTYGNGNDGEGGKGPFGPSFPVGQVNYDDNGTGYWLHFGTPNPTGTEEGQYAFVEILADDLDLVVRAKARDGKAGGLGFYIERYDVALA